MQVLLFDDMAGRQQLYPFTAIRPLADIRAGILTFRERWKLLLQNDVYSVTEGYLQKYESASSSHDNDYYYIHARLLPQKEMIEAIQQLGDEEVLLSNDTVIAIKTKKELSYPIGHGELHAYKKIALKQPVVFLDYVFDIVKRNDELLRFDFALLTKGRTSAPVSSTNRITGQENIFLEEGAVVEHSIINATTGPVYIGKNSLVMEGNMIRGPFAMLENSVLKMGSKLYGAVTIGRQCTAGGEIKNSVLFDYSNKAHDGYLGDAVIGSWCNLGAGTSCSNLKNTAGEIKIWNASMHQWINAGNKCGVMMGDYSRSAIQTSFNTGTVTGICCNVVSAGFVPKFVNDFTWNTATSEQYVLEKAIRDIDNWMKLKNRNISEPEIEILTNIYNQQSQQ
jgi:UDP-N-acetylglucosamine diphosphorylase / glucose-1-phosphate thymidylyltransferase / UDP-N-acetylgalactosamine diphosphorylase / glucosamine-1-phosphate N-acetyltransferase / galactosamine-1-phosphate N-acetyltransferase